MLCCTCWFGERFPIARDVPRDFSQDGLDSGEHKEVMPFT